MISALAEARLKRNNSFANSHPPLTDAGLIINFSSTGEVKRRKLIKSNSSLTPHIPDIFTRCKEEYGQSQQSRFHSSIKMLGTGDKTLDSSGEPKKNQQNQKP